MSLLEKGPLLVVSVV